MRKTHPLLSPDQKNVGCEKPNIRLDDHDLCRLAVMLSYNHQTVIPDSTFNEGEQTFEMNAETPAFARRTDLDALRAGAMLLLVFLERVHQFQSVRNCG